LRVWVAVAPADFRCGIDGLARRVRQVLAADPMSGALFVFRNRRGTAASPLIEKAPDSANERDPPPVVGGLR
jgi:transposase